MKTESQRLVRLAAVGAGVHATNNLYPSLRFAPIDLKAVFSRKEEKAKRAARNFGAERWYTDWEKMLDSEELDAVLACGPPRLHYEVGLAAMQRGLHVFTDKPPAENLDQARELYQVSRQTGRHFMMGCNKRFNPNHQRAKALAYSPEFGGPVHACFQFAGPSVLDTHGMLIFLAIHALDLSRFLLGDVSHLYVLRTDTSEGPAFSIAAQFASGATAAFAISRLHGDLYERTELFCAKRRLIVINNVVELELHSTMPLSVTEDDYPPASDIIHWRPAFALPMKELSTLTLQGFIGEIQEFASAVLENRPPSVSARDAYEVMRFIEAIQRTPDGRVDMTSVE